MDCEKKIPTAPLIVARLSRDFCCGTSRIELLHRCETDDKHPITHPAGYYDDSGDEVPITAIESWLDVNLPELAESEDEKIRKEIIEYIKSGEQRKCYNKRWIAYLEKQKEQKPIEKQDYSGLTDFERAIHRGFLCAGVENVPVEIIKETAQDCLAQMKPAEWSEEDKNKLYRVMETLIADKTIAQRKYPRCKALHKAYDELIDWLKSLKNRENFLKSNINSTSWKPSKEQMKAVICAIEECGYNSGLESLYNDLKKL